MKKYIFLILLSGLVFQNTISQVTLEADGPGDTYELINSVLAPGYDVCEVPDCAHPDFGRHIDEVYDSVLQKYVFRFHIHVTPDNDRCINFDRQRNEIKSYDKSPSSLKAVVGEKVEYKWKFKLDSAFQSSASFTHIHQIKAVGGSEESMPLITLTTRLGNPDKLELRYAKNTSQTTLKKVDLDPFKGEWVEAQEIILYGEEGSASYDLILKKVSDGTVLFEYSTDTRRMWKTDASFCRPKWGIYRSLNDSGNLRDEQVLFTDFSIEELDPTVGVKETAGNYRLTALFRNPVQDKLMLSSEAANTFNTLEIYSVTGKLIMRKEIGSNTVELSGLERGLYVVLFKGYGIKPESQKMIKE